MLGITPILQVLRSVLQDTSDTTTKLWLISANRTERDILCREEIDRFFASHGERFKVHYTLSSADAASDWLYGKGRITESMLRVHLPTPGPGKLILACGPQSMIDVALKGGLQNCGWDIKEQLVVF